MGRSQHTSESCITYAHMSGGGGTSIESALRACTNITFLRVATVAAPSDGVLKGSPRRSRLSFPMATLTPLDDVISHAIRRRGNWEGITSASDVAPVAGSGGGTFIDIGSNLGYFSHIFAREGFRVIAIEPLTHNRHAIEATLCMNPRFRRRGFEVLPLAVGPPAECWSIVNHRNRGNGRMQCNFVSKLGARGATTYTGTAAAVAKTLSAACSKQRLVYNGSLSTCEPVKMVPLDNALAHVQEAVPRPVIAKIDLEGGECGALETSATLATRLRVEYIWIEAKLPKTQRCMQKWADRYGYAIGEARPGVDKNTLLTRKAEAHTLVFGQERR